ncbi:MAG: hypothetical protein NTW87_14280, partial [Planctomycetota bacterium]|nr:hypothetical protein [Planctomycetota bacterium]
SLFTALGYYEVVSDSLIDPRWPAPAVWTARTPLLLDRGSVLREDRGALRNSLLASLLNVRRYNQDQRTGEARLFELGNVFLPGQSAQPEERHVLGLLDDRGFQALADAVLRLGEALELEDAHLKLSAPSGGPPPFLHGGQACHVLRVRVMPGNERAEDVVGWLGLVSAELQNAFDLRKPAAMCELDMSKLALLPSGPRRYADPPAYPEIVRDIAMVVDEAVTWGEIRAFARKWTEGEPLRDRNEPPRFMSVFRGKQIGPGKKSVAFSLVYRAADRTLTDDEVNAAHAKFQQALLAHFHATLRA